jgi:hypothetical protein
LMRCYRARLEVARDDMAHAGSTGSITHFGCCDSLWQTSALPSPERYQRRDATSLIRSTPRGRWCQLIESGCDWS